MPEEEQTEPVENPLADDPVEDEDVRYTEVKPLPQPYNPLTHGLDMEE
ncbi:MAG: hypothetical protein JXR49_19380 [Acidobacteria bacterium]|nr:hypothetical protein [Acidobacteriota bacterium]